MGSAWRCTEPFIHRTTGSRLLHTESVNIDRILLVAGAAAMGAGLLLVFVLNGEAGWFTHAPLAEGEALGFTGATLVTDQEKYGFLLIAVASILGAGVLGHRLGARQRR